ncbi:hypothetical protein B5F40_10290 [Gordonibacter sp. An230]|uniref:hypothetical protein n=1 Tax=Gordonibacter sp. An230 TaxID=1965592 RepID=UPI000B384D2A|nr:hypothetical protein [Gordonibacter sp. An230]OUO89615.1 hypothetical protein B5F40_10290 [Gordonibacter sp. An230]
MAENGMHSLYGSTNDSSSVPDASSHPGPAFDAKGCLVLADSFKVSPADVLANIETLHLADVLALWECHEGNWARDSPLLLRFEECDLAASTEPDGRLILWKGAVDTSLKVNAVASSSPEAEEQNDRLCLAWMTVSTLSEAIGQEASSIRLERNARLIVDLEETRILIEARWGSAPLSLESQPTPSSSKR